MISGPLAWSLEKDCNLYLERTHEPQLVPVVYGNYLSFRKWIDASMTGFEYRIHVQDIVDIKVTADFRVLITTTKDNVKIMSFYEDPSESKQTMHSNGATNSIGIGAFANAALAESFTMKLEELFRLIGDRVLLFDELEHLEWDS